MKKITFLLLAMLVGFFMQAQRVTDVPFMQASKTKMVFKSQQRVQPLSSRAIGDTIWSDDFSDTTKWKMYSDTSDYSGHWVIQNTENSSFGYGTGTIHSTTWQNGYAAFDADANGADGMNDASNEYIEYVGTIDCSSLKNVILVGQQYGRKWQTTHIFVEVSTDSLNWTSFEIDPNLQIKILAPDTFFTVNISTVAALQSTVYLRFHYKGGWDYGWCFDDLAIVEGPENDIAFDYYIPQFIFVNSSNAYVDYWYEKLPMKQTRPIAVWKSTIMNNGLNTATGVKLNVDISDENGDSAYSFSYDTLVINGGIDTIGSFASDTIDPPLSNAFYMDTTAMHKYTIKSYISMDSTDQQPLNDTVQEFHLNLTDTVMARFETNTTFVGVPDYSSSNSGDMIGTRFYLPNEDTVGSVTFYISSTTDTTDVSFDISISTSSDAGATWSNDVITASDVVPVTSDMLGKWVTVPFDYNIFDRTIEAGSLVIVWIKQYFSTGQTFRIGANDVYPDEDGYSKGGYINLGGTMYRISSAPTIQLNFHRTPVDGIHEVKISDSPVNVYPNPAMNQLHINGVVEGSTIEIYNMLGAEVASIAHANVSNTMSVAELPAGNYIVKIVNNNQVVTRKIAIVK